MLGTIVQFISKKPSCINLLPFHIDEESCFAPSFLHYSITRNTHGAGGITTFEDLVIDTSLVALQGHFYLGKSSCFTYCTLQFSLMLIQH
jgi:hypothetical protein